MIFNRNLAKIEEFDRINNDANRTEIGASIVPDFIRGFKFKIDEVRRLKLNCVEII